MVIIDSEKITNELEKMFDDVLCNMDSRISEKLQNAAEIETNSTCKFALDIMCKNQEIARRDHIAICQDTGMAIVFMAVGDEVFIKGNVNDAVNEGVRRAYSKAYRKSILYPLTRKNTGDNTPAIVHIEIVKGTEIQLSCMAKGFGSENMSRVYMLNPSDGEGGIIRAVIQTVSEAGGCPCPPVIIGIGVGGDMEKAAILSKKALFRDLDSVNTDKDVNLLEQKILSELNKLNIGALGYGGNVTALGVFIETFPTHIAGLPVAITVQCHVSRHKTAMIK